MNTKSRYANDYLRAGRQPLWWSIDTNRVRNQVFRYECQDVTVMAQLSHRSSLPAISAEVAPFYRVYLGKCGLETYYGWKTNSEKLDSGLCG